MRRRVFITLLGGAAAAWPLAARAQQSAMPVIGFLSTSSPEAVTDRLRAFHQGLQETGYVEGQNLAIDYRWAHGEFGRLSELAADLVRHQVAVLVTSENPPAALAAKAASATIPIVFLMGGDPVQVGLVASLNRPGGNVTGVSAMTVDVAGKRVGLLQELLPGATRSAVLLNANEPRAESMILDLLAAAAAIGRQIEVLAVRTASDIGSAFVSLAQKRAEALFVTPSPLFLTRHVQLITLAARHMLPASYPTREFAEAGGLMSYGGKIREQYRQGGFYTGRILKGEKPGDLPVLRAAEFAFVINLKTAKALGLTVPPTLLARADEVIE
jgi:putative ABC transport system substrate-binding protein